MTVSAVPDLLASVLAANPDELHLTEGPYGFTLVIDAPDIDLRGSVFASRRDRVAAFAMAFDRALRDLRSPAPRCECGDLQTSHDMRLKTKKPCGRYGCGCTAWRPAEGAA